MSQESSKRKALAQGAEQVLRGLSGLDAVPVDVALLRPVLHELACKLCAVGTDSQ